MRLTVLGNTGRYLAPLSGGSGYLVEREGARVLLDCGGGVRDALVRAGVERLDAVVLSHFHFDHVLDFPMIRHALHEKSVLFVPPGERARLDALAQAYVFDGPYDLPCPIVEAQPGRAHRVGDLELSFAPTQHSAPSMATRVQPAGGGASLVYASDGAPCDPLRDLARGADTLLMHALLPTVDPASEHARIHATASTAAALATVAGARRLLLSHRYHESRDVDMLGEARLFRDVMLVRDGASYDV